MKPLRQDFSKPDIEQSLPLRELATLIAVAQMGSASKAAEALGYAQSTVSLHVHVLERYLAVALFERNGRCLALTPAGRMAVDRGAALLDQARAFRAIVRARGDEVTGSVAIGSVEPTATHRLPAAIAAFAQKHPEVRIDVRIVGSATAADLVRSREVEFALCSAPRGDKEFRFTLLFQEPLGVLVPKRHRLAHEPRVALSDLASERLLVSDDGAPIARW